MAEMKTDVWSDGLTGELSALFPDELEFLSYVGQPFVTCQPALVLPLLGALKRDFAFDFLVDITAVDYPQREARFDLVYIVYSFARNFRMRVKTRIEEAHRPPSATAVYKTADWLEREVYDMFGIEFTGHPNLKRILMPEEWTGFPLRKSYSIIQQDTAWVQEHLGIESGQ